LGRLRRAIFGSGCQPLRAISRVMAERARWSPAAIQAAEKLNFSKRAKNGSR